MIDEPLTDHGCAGHSGSTPTPSRLRRAQMNRFQFPNIRRMFVPDPNHDFFDIDLSSADLRVVVWESDCRNLKAMFAEGLNPYVETAKEYYHDPSITKKHKKYTEFKSFCHGIDYLGKGVNVGLRCGLLAHESDKLERWWFQRNPEIKKWQERIINDVNTKRFISNAWGYRLHLFDRIDENTYRECAAWIPQSTVGILINHAYVNIDKNLPEVQVLLQVHDSLAGQYPSGKGDYYRRVIVEQSTVPVPYPDPLIIPVGIKTSPLSWGDCE